MKRASFLLAFLLIIFSAKAQYISSVTTPSDSLPPVDTSSLSFRLAQGIQADQMRKHLNIIASDEFEGRETGHPGNEMAAQYIKNHFINIGFPPINKTYFQEIQFTWESWDKIEMEVGDVTFKHLWDFLAFQNKNNDWGTFDIDEMLFLGYGIDDPAYSDYQRVKKKIKGKSIIVYSGEPMNQAGMSRISGTTTPSDWNQNIEKKLEVAKKYGVKHVFFIADDIKALLAKYRKQLIGSTVSIEPIQERDYPSNAIISTSIAKEILGKKLKKVIRVRDKITKKGKPRCVKINTDIQMTMDKMVTSLNGKNVLGYVKGSTYPDETVVLSAHFDHIGKRGESIFNGADDNGSGTVTLLEIAETYAEAIKAGNRPKRSVLFLLLTGEEKGLLGSEYYTQKPIIPLDQLMVDINVDMVGRVDDKYTDNPNYIYVIGSDRLSKELHQTNETINNRFERLVLDYTYNSENDPNRYYYRSDHYNFAKNGIPSVFFFNGTHADYHQATDTVEKINYDKLERIARHIFHLSWELANQPKPLSRDKKASN